MTNNLGNLRDRSRDRMPSVIADLRAKALQRAPEAVAQREAGYSIRNHMDVTVVRIYEEIWANGVNAEDFARDLDQITTPRIEVQINSPGGDVFDGVAIYNALRTHPAHVTTRVDGVAASIASVIAQAGDRRVVLSSGQVMVHNAWALTIGDRRDHAEMRDLLEQQDDIIAGIYASRSGRSKAHFRRLMDAETWLAGRSIVDEGLADEVVDPPRQDVSAAELASVLAEARRHLDDHERREAEAKAILNAEYERFKNFQARAELAEVHERFCDFVEHERKLRASRLVYVDAGPPIPEIADAAESMLRICARELGIDPPPLIWMMAETPAQAAWAAERPREWPHIFTDRRLYGAFHEHTGTVWCRSDLTLDRTLTTVAHEVRHAAGGDEDEAQAYEARWRNTLPTPN